MSYLGYPRLHFAGSFQADVSTVNNDPEHFDDARFLARYQQPGPGATNGWWNPRGTGSWRLRDCSVTAIHSEPALAGDALLGGSLSDASTRVSAKLVDLDPEQQMVSMIFGLGLELRDPAGNLAFAGDFLPAPFSDIWVRYPPGQPDSFFSAVYQSIVTVTTWGDLPASPFLAALREATNGDELSIKFTVDGFDDDSSSPSFTWGRIAGTIGPSLAGEPRHFVAERLLRAPGGSPMNAAPFRIDESTATLHLDIGNSVQTTSVGGPFADLGMVQLVATPEDGPPVALATFAPSAPELYPANAGILSIKLSPAQLGAAAATPLALLDPTGLTTLLAESPDGTYARADEFVFRMSPGDVATTTIYATAFGKPAPDVTLDTFYDDSGLVSQVMQGPLPGPPVGQPRSALTFPPSVTTGADGTAALTLTAGDPAGFRGYIDGQVYCVGYGIGEDPTIANGLELSVLVFDGYTAPEQPTWVADVQPIFQQYANLYPAMRDLVDLSDYGSVVSRKRAIQAAMALPVEDPNSMPVTRDLSPAKRAMVLSWLAEPAPPAFAITDVESLRQVVQLAIELEHATIPPYLTAYYSLMPGRNIEVAELIRSVVMEEMVHLALAANILNAIGGSPQIDTPAFVPKYPGHLPGGVRPDLMVSLRRCTKEHIRDVFCSIEEPGQVQFVSAFDPPSPTDPDRWFTEVVQEPLTIGWFYGEIAKAIVTLDAAGGLWTGDPARQVTPAIWGDDEMIEVVDKDSALKAITEIVEQGEGATLTNPVDDRGDLAHFFRFQEIVHGRQMVQDASGTWVFEGPPIPFDESGVYPMADDPDTGSLPPGSQARSRSALFNRTYTDLLSALHDVFNGAPENLDSTLGLMFSCGMQARQLMETPVAPGAPFTAGPSFQPGSS